MRILLIVIILVARLSACFAQKSGELHQVLDLDGVITIHIKSVPQSENILVKLGTYHSFPQSDVSEVQDTITFSTTEIYLKGPCRTLGRSFLHIADSLYEVVGAPGDTINVSILADRSNTNEPIPLSFEGKNKEIQQYYQAKKRHMNDPSQVCMNEGIQAATLKPFMEMMDTTYREQYQFWTNYQKKHKLPDWFIVYETNVLNYSDAWLRVYMIWYQIKYQKKKQVIPESYYAFKSRIKLKNEAIMYQYEYLRFLREQLFWQMRNSKITNSYETMMSSAKQEFGENLGSFFEIWEMSRAVDNPNWVDTKFNKQFPSKYQYLVDYIKLRSKENIKQLKPGDRAPNFALVDLNDSLVTLSQYKGHVILLSFWFTTCGPCIKEIPYENKLVEHFKDKPVKIISICTGTPGAADDQQISKWKATSKRFGLKTIDLFSSRAWTKTLAQNYKVSVYPHYVLIGSDGKIIENFTDRPSQGVASKIEKALSENGG
jgi:peroxiredoxin